MESAADQRFHANRALAEDAISRRDGDLTIAALGSPKAAAVPRNSPTQDIGGSFGADGMRVPLFFGFVEFDWDSDAPGFGPMSNSAPASR